MDNSPSPEPKTQTTESPPPEVLTPRVEDSSLSADLPVAPKSAIKAVARMHRNNYHPGHKGMFIGITVVVLVLAINAGIITFVLKSQSKSKSQGTQAQVQISQGVLDKLGVNRSAIGDSGIQLAIGPNTKFGGKVQVAGDVSVAGQLKLSSKFSAADASLAQLEAGNTSLSQLNVNGDSNVSNLNLRNNLLVTGLTRLQGAVTITQLLTVSNSVNVSGNLAIGGVLSTNGLSVHSMSIDSTLTIGGHVITRGAAPNVGPGGPALGSNGNVSISGNDAAGTVSINIGGGPNAGTLAKVAFHNSFSDTPHVVITPVGFGGPIYITSLSSSGFTINTATPISPGGYAVEYIVEQ